MSEFPKQIAVNYIDTGERRYPHPNEAYCFWAGGFGLRGPIHHIPAPEGQQGRWDLPEHAIAIYHKAPGQSL